MQKKIPAQVVLSAPLGGAVLTAERLPGPSLADLLPYAPAVDRADYDGLSTDNVHPQRRIGYAA